MVNGSYAKQLPINQMLRKEYQCDDIWIGDFLSRIQVGHVATQIEKQPFITPVLYWYDAECHEIYFHTNVAGRLRANSEHEPSACFEVMNVGKLLPSNVALEFSVQYESVIVFGKIRIVYDAIDQRRILDGLIKKYFPDLSPGVDYRPITDRELKHTSVFALEIESWSGKRNWSEKADQSPDWPALQDDLGRDMD